jgi:hypothetical protein
MLWACALHCEGGEGVTCLPAAGLALGQGLSIQQPAERWSGDAGIVDMDEQRGARLEGLGGECWVIVQGRRNCTGAKVGGVNF